ncbi:flagellar motor switch protein FliG [Desulfofarcimen acetoxidans DSM 771]|uniref:Flagellar motor switch protein FliG n=1 Tax=Desulfofarcimen acetoxidans (strain ATCC 49208 / DSM 771 / KCTC 5769 / VKM B-1644 / 5575) TaxID=485916 RepID=C8W1F8_DESAS|nr:flagellar motor switch protein FliG [Desulfofarcimen acetoxidans DSM 771]
MSVKNGKLTGYQKAAILLISMGSDLSSVILKEDFYEKDIERLSVEISKFDRIPAEIMESVLSEFNDLYQARQYLLLGGVKYAQDILEKTLGTQKALDIMKKLAGRDSNIPFASLRKTDPRHLMSYLQDEHPQIVALILAYLESEQSSAILSALPHDVQSDISKRIATMGRPSPEVVKEVERVLAHKMSEVLDKDNAEIGGVKTLVNILNMVDRSTERSILKDLEEEDPMLAEEIRKRMFVFENIVKLSDSDVQRVLRDVNPKDLAVALRGASEEVSNKIFKNQSKRSAGMLKEEIDLMGPVRLKVVEESQQKIVKIIRTLEDAGEVTISQGEEDAVVL